MPNSNTLDKATKSSAEFYFRLGNPNVNRGLNTRLERLNEEGQLASASQDFETLEAIHRAISASDNESPKVVFTNSLKSKDFNLLEKIKELAEKGKNIFLFLMSGHEKDQIEKPENVELLSLQDEHGHLISNFKDWLSKNVSERLAQIPFIKTPVSNGEAFWKPLAEAFLGVAEKPSAETKQAA